MRGTGGKYGELREEMVIKLDEGTQYSGRNYYRSFGNFPGGAFRRDREPLRF